MQGDQPISWLMFFTFAATIFIIAFSFIHFASRRRNREIAENALTGSDHPASNKVADGALPDLLGITLFAFIAMGLLALGYSHRTSAGGPTAVPMSGSR